MSFRSLEEFFLSMKKHNVLFVVLRKYDRLPFSFVEDDHDLDILCQDKDEFVRFSHAKKRNVGISAYRIEVDSKWIDLDIRFVGDGYFDKKWEEAVLKSHIWYNDCVPIMDNENNYYTILYHCLTQKEEISEYYLNKIMELRCKLHYDITGNAKSEIFIDELERFMAERRYTFKRPTDISVYQSKYVLGKGRYYDLKLPFRIKCFLILYAKTPDYLRKMLPDRMKEFFTNLV